MRTSQYRDLLYTRIPTIEALRDWLALFCDLRLPLKSICSHHQSPLEYLWRAYNEPAEDLIVIAPRGGGKTRLGAAATLLDLMHKPGVGVRILGGSLEQSHRMWQHLLPDVQRLCKDLLRGPARVGRSVELANGSRAGVIAQSQTAVRGLRVQKLRCDEVELFDRGVWQAAQLVTRSAECRVLSAESKKLTPGTRNSQLNARNSQLKNVPIRGTIEAISTHHKPYGLMSELIDRAPQTGARVLRWCVLDVLERCPPERECGSCALWDECRGVAKERCDGYMKIDDVIRQKHRASAEMWDAEMLCNKPTARGRVFPTFSEEVHVREVASCESGVGSGERDAGLSLAIDFGFENPFVCLWVRRIGDVTHVIDEYVQQHRTVEQHLQEIEARQWGKVKRVSCDPAGNSRNEQTAKSNIALLRNRGYTVRTKGSRIVDGLELIRAALRPAAGEPRLFVDPRCARLIKALNCYHYADGARSELPEKDGEHDHPIDALRYYFVNLANAGIAQGKWY